MGYIEDRDNARLVAYLQMINKQQEQQAQPSQPTEGGGLVSSLAPVGLQYGIKSYLASPTAAASATTVPGGVATGLGGETIMASAPSAAAPTTSGIGAATPIAAPIIAAIAAAMNYGRNAKQYKTESRGASIRQAMKDPINWIVPSGVLGAAFGDKDLYLKERRRLEGLRSSGTYIPDNVYADTNLRKGRSKQELVDIAKTTGGNVKFADSRNEKDLTGIDLANYATFAKNDPDWFKKSVDERAAYGQKALDAGAVREHHGTIDVDFSKLNSPAPDPKTEKLKEFLKSSPSKKK